MLENYDPLVLDLDDSFGTLEDRHVRSLTVKGETFTGGLHPNMPDVAGAALDFSTVLGAGRDGILRRAADDDTDLLVETMLDLAPNWTDPSRAVSQHLKQAVDDRTGAAPEEPAVSHFADGLVFTPLSGASVYICRPGDPDQPNTVNESCSGQRICEAERIYHRLSHAASELSERTVRQTQGEA